MKLIVLMIELAVLNRGIIYPSAFTIMLTNNVG